ncbi:MAG: hypothetical protein IJS47_04380 [Clostridia bacterium]|nr:hypothetical protein [Clostridia bacterium]
MDKKIYRGVLCEEVPQEYAANTLYLQTFAVDTVGTTDGSVWVRVYGDRRNGEVALFKPEDPEEIDGAQAELISSHFEKMMLEGVHVRVPEINIVKAPCITGIGNGILSYRLNDSVREDFIHIGSLLRYKFTGAQISKLYTLGIQDILDCIRMEVNDATNFKEIEEAVVKVILTDAFSNNADRHGKNWALVRDKDTNHSELAIFDNVKSFINMMTDRVGYKHDDLWSIGYLGVDSKELPEIGERIVKGIEKMYPEYFNQFMTRFNNIRDIFCEDIVGINGVNASRIESVFRKKAHEFDREKDYQMDW